MTVNYGVDLGTIKTNCPFCNPHPGASSTRKQRIEEMCKVIGHGVLTGAVIEELSQDASVSEWIVGVSEEIINKIDALDEEQ
jgi:hypothetical protein